MRLDRGNILKPTPGLYLIPIKSYKQKSYNVSGKILYWFVSYLSDREQRVIVNGKTSGWVKVKSGVPEGALLAPLLFSLFINDLPAVVASSNCIMYADDVKIY